MCRMLIAVGKTTLAPLIDGLIEMADNKHTFHELNKKKGIGSLKHTDGWGIAYLDKGKWEVIKSIKPAHADPKINTLRNIQTELAVLHARKAAGSGVALENTHPFQANDNGETYLFCHNGYLREKITFSSRFKPIGHTDSEKLFYSILSEIPKKTVVEAIQKNLQKYKKNWGTNIILATAEHSHISLRENDWPFYYQMHLGKQKGLTIISSEELPVLKKMEWQPLEPRQTIVINNKTQEIKRYSY